MSRIQDYFAQFYADGALAWPESQEARNKLADDLLGAEIVSSLDHWVDRALDLMHNEEPAKPFPRQNEAWKREMYFRRGLASLNAEQKRLVSALVTETASGALFSTLVAFDQCAELTISIDARPFESEEIVASILPGEDDLHDRFYDWIDRFCDDGLRYDPSTDLSDGGS